MSDAVLGDVPAESAASVPRRSPLVERRVAEALVLVAMAIWALNFIAVKTAIATIPPVGFAFVRFGLAGLFLLGLARLLEGPVRLPRRDLLPLLGLGAIGFGIYQVLWATALQVTKAGTSSLIVATTPIFTMLLAAAIGSDTFSRARGIGALLAFGGVGLVIAEGSGIALEGSGQLAGAILTLVAAVLWAVYMSFGAPFLRRHTPLLTTAWAMVGGGLSLAPLGLWQLTTVRPADVTPAIVLALGYSSLFAAAVSNVLVFRGVRLLGPTRVSNLQFLVPAMTVVLAAVLLAEPVGPAQIAGGLAIVAGILVARRDPGRRGGRPSPVEAELIEPA